MWTIVAVTFALLHGAPKFTVVPGSDYPSEAACKQAEQASAGIKPGGAGVSFSLCMPKDAVQIGKGA